MSTPRVSVIIPTYNYAHYITEAIDSILQSDFPLEQIEILVIDDGSTDQTQEKISSYAHIVKYFYQENAGKASATKLGIDLSQGQYIFNLDADDLFLPNKISEVVQAFESDSDLVHVAHPAMYWYTNEGSKDVEPIPVDLLGCKLIGRQLLSYFYKRGILFGGGSTFAARADVLKNCPIPKAVDIYIDEYLVLSVLNQGYSHFLKQPLSVWRIHGTNFSDLHTNPTLYRYKMQRSLKSMEAVLECLTRGEYEQDIQKYYSLKLKTMTLSLKEDLGEKSFSDIVSLWFLFLQSFSLLNPESFRLVKAYTLLNRSLPTPIIKFVQNNKRRFSLTLSK